MSVIITITVLAARAAAAFVSVTADTFVTIMTPVLGMAAAATVSRGSHGDCGSRCGDGVGAHDEVGGNSAAGSGSVFTVTSVVVAAARAALISVAATTDRTRGGGIASHLEAMVST